MTFDDFIQQNRPNLEKFIIKFLDSKKRLSKDDHFHNDLLSRLTNFVLKGKMLRGLFLILIANIYNPKLNKTAILPLAASIELIQSALLIHDDIMDNDRLRRGDPTIFAQYEQFALSKKITQPTHYGQSMGICVGDMTYFLSFELMNMIDNKNKSAQISFFFKGDSSSLCRSDDRYALWII